MFGMSGNAFLDSGFMFVINGTWPVMVFALAGVFPVTVKMLKKFPAAESAWLCMVLVLSVCEIVGASYNPFIYFNF